MILGCRAALLNIAFWLLSVYAAPPLIDAPDFRALGSQENTVVLNLRRASEKHGKIGYYLVVVVPEPASKVPEQYTTDQVSPPPLNQIINGWNNKQI